MTENSPVIRKSPATFPTHTKDEFSVIATSYFEGASTCVMSRDLSKDVMCIILSTTLWRTNTHTRRCYHIDNVTNASDAFYNSWRGYLLLLFYLPDWCGSALTDLV